MKDKSIDVHGLPELLARRQARRDSIPSTERLVKNPEAPARTWSEEKGLTKKQGEIVSDEDPLEKSTASWRSISEVQYICQKREIRIPPLENLDAQEFEAVYGKAERESFGETLEIEAERKEVQFRKFKASRDNLKE